jgi:hypothetical protein
MKASVQEQSKDSLSAASILIYFVQAQMINGQFLLIFHLCLLLLLFYTDKTLCYNNYELQNVSLLSSHEVKPYEYS